MVKFPKPRSPEEISARIAEIDLEIIRRKDTSNLAGIAGKNELGTSLEESGLEEEKNDADFAQEAAKIRSLLEEKEELQTLLHELAKTA